MAWAKAGSTTLASAGDDLDVTFTASKFNQLMVHLVQSADASMLMNFENNSSTDYAYRHSANGSEQTEVNQTKLNWTGSLNQINPNFMVMNIMNISGEEKLGIGFVVSQTSAGAGNAPSRKEYYVKFDTTTDSGQITRVDFHSSATNAIPAGSNVSVLGSDLTPSAGKPTNVQVGSRFEETDTRKMYHYGGGGGSITKDAQATTNTSSSGTTITNSSFTVANNSNRILIVCAYRYGSGGDISGITWNGSESFTRATFRDGSTETGRTEIWYLVNPTATTASVVTTWDASTSRRGAGVYSFYNAKQTSPIGATAYDDEIITVTDGAITPTVTGSMIVDVIGSGSNGAPVDTLTAGWTSLIGGDDRSFSSQYKLNPTISSANTMAWTFTNDKGVNWIATEIKSAVDEWKELGT